LASIPWYQGLQGGWPTVLQTVLQTGILVLFIPCCFLGTKDYWEAKEYLPTGWLPVVTFSVTFYVTFFGE
jgi:hypothetical protein